MLQSANRETQDSLKMFQDRGDVHGFFHRKVSNRRTTPRLKRPPTSHAYAGMLPMVKDSLGNALRIIRPVVVLDEGHRAISDLAFRTLYGFNPCFGAGINSYAQGRAATWRKEPARWPLCECASRGHGARIGSGRHDKNAA